MGGRTGRTARKSPIQPKNIVVVPQDPLGLIPEVHVQALDLWELSAKEAGGFLKDIVERNTFEGKIAPIEQFARKVWKKAGLPEFDSWKVIPLPDGGDGTPGKLVEDKPYSPEWFAASILRSSTPDRGHGWRRIRYRSPRLHAMFARRPGRCHRIHAKCFRTA